jgi:Na+/melibiose symporter-like transporter
VLRDVEKEAEINIPMSNSLTQKRLSFLEKAGYSLGDMGANLVFQLLMSFQFIFFTGVMGLSPGAAGTLFLVGRFFDAFTDPMMGIIADRTKTRWGRFRPWLVWSALPAHGDLHCEQCALLCTERGHDGGS